MHLAALLGSELPLIQAPMAGSQDHRLAAAVSQAGGLGSIPCAMLTAAALRQALQTMRDLTERPFNLNFFSHVSPEPDAAREAGWREALAPYYGELGVDPANIASGPGRLPFNAEAAELVEEFAVDAGTIRQVMALEEQAAKELGQWVEKQQFEDVTRVVEIVGVDAEAI